MIDYCDPLSHDSQLLGIPRVTTGRTRSAWILIRAISVLESRPLTSASYSLPLDSFTRILSAFSTT